jgi:hypothetical protein
LYVDIVEEHLLVVIIEEQLLVVLVLCLDAALCRVLEARPPWARGCVSF